MIAVVGLMPRRPVSAVLFQVWKGSEEPFWVPFSMEAIFGFSFPVPPVSPLLSQLELSSLVQDVCMYLNLAAHQASAFT